MRHDSDNYAALDQAWETYFAGDLPRALGLAVAALKTDASAEAYNLVGTIHAALGNLAEALSHYQASLEQDEFFFDALLNSGDVLIQMGQPAAALPMILAALEATDEADGKLDASLLQIDALVLLSKNDEALNALSAMPQGPYPDPRMELAVGRACLQLGEFERARVLLEGAAMVGLDTADLYFYLSHARDSLGDAMGSIVASLQCREKDQDAPNAPWAESSKAFEERVRAAIGRMPQALSNELEGALVVTPRLPGTEYVAEGLDPRAPAMMDEIPLRTGKAVLRRLFVYQRNVDRFVTGSDQIDDELDRVLKAEVRAFLAVLERPEPSAP